MLHIYVFILLLIKKMLEDVSALLGLSNDEEPVTNFTRGNLVPMCRQLYICMTPPRTCNGTLTTPSATYIIVTTNC